MPFWPLEGSMRSKKTDILGLRTRMPEVIDYVSQGGSAVLVELPGGSSAWLVLEEDLAELIRKTPHDDGVFEAPMGRRDPYRRRRPSLSI